jgi:geranylgeranyl diphosphate synthase type II
MELAWIADGTWNLRDEDYELMVLRKTCGYSFVAPALVGAEIAKAPPETQALLTDFLRELGLAFQIRDDLLNLEQGRDQYGKELAGDLWEGKRTLMLLHMLRNSSETDRARALSILAKPRPTLTDADAITPLLQEMVQAGVVDEATRARMESFLATRPGHASKTVEDVRFLEGLLKQHQSLDHARAISDRHAAAAETALLRLQDKLPTSVHADFLTWIKDYVVRRDW